MTGRRENAPQFGEDAPERSLRAWRRKALDVYTLVAAAIHLPFLVVIALSPKVSARHGLMALFAWCLTLAAAALRPLSMGTRLVLLAGAVWVYAATMLDRSGVFMDFRLALAGTPVVFVVLGGVRRGIAIGAVNLLLIIAGFWATGAGWLPQTSPPWHSGEWIVQSSTVAAQTISSLLLLVWFSRHLAISMHREQLTAARLRSEAVERERLESEVLEAGEQESRRIGNELHDGVCQDLTGLLIGAKRAQKSLAVQQSPQAQTLGRIVEGLGEAIGEIHGLSRRLSPGALTGNDLGGALKSLVQRFAEFSDAGIVFRTAGSSACMDSRVALHLYRIAQEAISNAIRHSGASRIEVSLEHEATESVLRVSDDGSGMPPDSAEQARGGLGLRTMTWRAAKAGGVLAISPRPKGGTRLECRVPAQKPAQKEDASLEVTRES